MGSGIYLNRAIEKHGIENFEKEILHVFDSPEEMFEMESTLVNEDFIKSKDTYNLKLGGIGGWDHNNTSSGIEKRRWTFEVWSKSGVDKFLEMFYNDDKFREDRLKHLREIQKKAIAATKGKPGSFLGKTHSKDTKEKMSQVAKERLKDPIKNSQYGTMWITDEINSKKIKKNDSIPEGWRKGRVIAK
jgi:hypothetical protein